jgi:hypothetical protein
MISRALLDYFKAQGVDVRAFDTQAETPAGVLKRFFPAQTEVVDLTKSDGQMKVFDTLQGSTVTVIDVAASLLSPTLKTLGEIGFMEAVREGKIRIVVLHVLGSSMASLAEIASTAAALAGAKHFLVTNHVNDSTFFAWDDKTKAALNVGDGVLDMPKLNELAVENVEIAGTSFRDYVANTSENSFVLRGYVRHWLGLVFAEFAKAKLTGE